MDGVIDYVYNASFHSERLKLILLTYSKQQIMAESLPEVWLRGPIAGVPSLLQPAAHALLQAAEEIETAMDHFPDRLLWERPAGCASAGFHLLHIAGVLNRLCTYALAKPLSSEQLVYLKEETIVHPLPSLDLVQGVKRQVGATIEQLKATTEADLAAARAVGRKGLPSTVQGLLFHAAEHTMRHLGQLMVTVKVVKEAAGRERHRVKNWRSDDRYGLE